MEPKKKRQILNITGAVVVVLWLVMVGLLIKKVHFGDVGERPEFSEKVYDVNSPERDWMEIYLKGKKVGYSVNQVSLLGEDYLIQEEIFLKLNLMGQTSAMRTLTRSVVNNEFCLKSFKFRITSGAVSFQVSGRVKGGRMHLKLGEGDTERTQTIELSSAPVMASGMAHFFKGRRIQVGDSFRFPLFDPSTTAQKEMVFRVMAKESLSINGIIYTAFRLEGEVWDRPLTFWLDKDGVLLKEEGFMGFTLVKSSAARAPRDISAGGDFYRLAAINVKKKLPDSDRLTYLRLKVEGLDGGHLDKGILNGGRQRFRDGVIEILREKTPLRATYTLPYPERSDEMIPFLRPEFGIESDHGMILRKAREISGDAKDPLKAASRLMGWVYGNLEKRPLVSVPSALEVLKTKVGDCNEHSVLLTALLRASGIPARVCVGLVYSRGRFYYHAWTEGYVGRWVSMDATLNQIPVDATHIKLIQGGLERQADIIGLIGKLKLSVIAYGYD